MKNVARVKEQSSTSGLSNYDLASSGTLYRRLRDEFASGERVRYYAQSASDFEEGIGILTTGSTDTLSRDTIIRSSTGAKINWPAGTRDIFIDPLPGSHPISDKSTNYTVTAQDLGTVIRFTGTTATLTLPTAASVGDGFSFEIKNDGSGAVTIDPAGSELINGALTLVLNAGSSGFVRCSGTAWHAVGFATLDINGLTEDTAPDGTADFLPIYDASATGNKKLQVRRAGAIVQTIHVTNSTYTTFSTNTLIPRDNTAPLNTEGNQVFSQAITLMRATGKVLLRGRVHVASVSATTHQLALFRGSTCIYAFGQYTGGSEEISLDFEHEDAPGSVGPHTYSVRVGNAGSTQYVNGNSTGAIFGGTYVSHFRLMEFTP